MLDLVGTVVRNMKGVSEGKIVMHADCRRAWELLTLETLQASQLAGNEGSIINMIMKLESKLKIEFEHVHVKTTNNEDNTIVSEGLETLLKHDKQVKEERIMRVR